MKISKRTVRSFYKSDRFKPILPENSTWYHYRIKLQDGTWRKIPLRINSPKKLQRAIVKRDGGDIYFSTALWLNPEKVGPRKHKKGYVIADMLLLKNEYVIDLDADTMSLEGLEDIRKHAVKLLNVMKKKRSYKLEYINFTGAKGFQLCYVKNEKISENPQKRLLEAGLRRKIFKNKLPTKIKFDVNTSMNPLLVRRVPGTINTKTGYLSTLITEEQLKKPIKELLKNIPYVTRSRPGIPLKREMTRTPRTIKQRIGGVAGLAPQSTLIPCFTNETQGCVDRYTLALQYHENTPYRRDLKFLQRHYKLSTVYVFKRKGYYWCLSAQTFPKLRLKKVLSRTKAMNVGQFRKLGYLMIPVRDQKLKEIIKSNNPLKNASKAHTRIIKLLSNKNIKKARFPEGNNNLCMMIQKQGTNNRISKDDKRNR